MNLSSFHLIIKNCRSSLFRSIVLTNQRQLSIIEKDSKKKENDVPVQSQNNNQIQTLTFIQKGIKNFF